MDNTQQFGLRLKPQMRGYVVGFVTLPESDSEIIVWNTVNLNELRLIMVGHLGYTHVEAAKLLTRAHSDQVIPLAPSPDRGDQRLDIYVCREGLEFRILGVNSQPADFQWLHLDQALLVTILMQFGFQTEPAIALIQAIALSPGAEFTIYPVEAA